MSNWSLIYDRFDPQEEGLREAMCALGNGYFCTRGAALESEADDTHYPGTYLAGGYNRLGTEMGGRIIENEDLVNMPNWLPLNFRIDEQWFNLRAVEILSYRQELDMRGGVLHRHVRFRLKDRRELTLRERRLVSMHAPHMAALETTVTAENWSGTVAVRSALDGQVINAGVARYRSLNSKHLQPVETAAVDAETVYLKVQTAQSEIRVAEAARTRVFADGEVLSVDRRVDEKAGYIAHEFDLRLQQGQPVTIEKVVGFYTSRDRAVCECGLDARNAVVRAGSFDDLLTDHAQAWEVLHRRFDGDVELSSPAADGRTLMIVRLHIFHLLQSVSPHSQDLDVGVPARGWHGEAYRGHVFWDELFIFPTLNLRIPEITRALLMYRCRRLGEARANAAKDGFRGAMYPWQSGSDGREESQSVHLNPKSGRWIPDHSWLQRHSNLAIAFNIWQYYQATLDTEFLSYHGAEVLLEIARFFANITSFNKDLDRYEILRVMGPDEYHEAYPDAEEAGLNNNGYTNVMVVWLLIHAIKVLDLMSDYRREELCERLELTQEEIDHWDDISRRMRVVFHGDGIISQFEDYDKLLEFDWEGYRKKYGDIHRLDRILEAEGDSANRYKLSKQGDVCMLFYLFSTEALQRLFKHMGYDFDPEMIPRNVDYYMQRTSHGSTLSRIVHSWVLARSDRSHSWRFFIQALESDIGDVQGGTTKEGIHMGAMAGSVDLIQRSYMGIEVRDYALWLNPCLPDELKRLRLRIRFQGHLLMLETTHDTLSVTTIKPKSGPIRVGIGGKLETIEAGQTREFPLAGGRLAAG